MVSHEKISTVSFITFCNFFITKAQPFTKKYIMAFHTCDNGCYGYQDHMVHLAESDDGTSWTEVPNFTPYTGSVPDVIVRGDKLYVYNPGKVLRYDNLSSTWDVSTTPVTIEDSLNNTINYVDPSAYIDSSGNIVLFFLNSTGLVGQDPAGCQTYPCIKYFDSAVEVAGSDGTEFVIQNGHRTELTLANSPLTASDPDIYFDGTKYIMYVSQGSNTLAYESSSLHGTYTAFPNLSNATLTSEGGIPCGHYDAATGKYWTYVHANVSGETVIKQAIHNDFNSQLNSGNFSTVISGPILGYPSDTKTESPGFCENTFLTSTIKEIKDDALNLYIYPIPSSDNLNIRFTLSFSEDLTLCMQNMLGEILATYKYNKLKSGNHSINLGISNLSSGIYNISLSTSTYKTTQRISLLK